MDAEILNESLRGFPAPDAADWHRLRELENVIDGASGRLVSNFSGLIAEMVRLRRKLGLPLGI